MKNNKKFPLMDEEMIQHMILLLEKGEERDFIEIENTILRGQLLLEQERMKNLTKREKMLLKGRLLIEQERIRNLTKKEKMVLKGRLLIEEDKINSLTKEDQMLYMGKILSEQKQTREMHEHKSVKQRRKPLFVQEQSQGKKTIETVIHRGKLLLDKKQKNERTDRVTIPNKMGELVLPIAHYALIDSKNPHSNNLKILIYGLGSCIALILYDGIAKLSAMTHIYLPKSSIGYFEENFPQKHADTAVMDLLNQMIKSGAKKENIKACIFGGATIFKESYSDMGERNSESVKNELKSLNIKIEREFIGGRKGSTIIFDVKNKIVLLPNLNKKIKI